MALSTTSIWHKMRFAAISAISAKWRFVAPHTNSTSDPQCGQHERPFFPPGGGTKFLAHAAILTLRARAAQNNNGRVGLSADLGCAAASGDRSGAAPAETAQSCRWSMPSNAAVAARFPAIRCSAKSVLFRTHSQRTELPVAFPINTFASRTFRKHFCWDADPAK